MRWVQLINSMSTSDIIISKNLTIPGKELKVQVSNSGGPGGQHANKTSTRVSLRWNINNSSVLSDWQRKKLLTFFLPRLTKSGDLLLHSDESRSQSFNHERVRIRLADLIREGLKPVKRRKATRPSWAAKEKRIKKKKVRSQIKKDRKYRGDRDS